MDICCLCEKQAYKGYMVDAWEWAVLSDNAERILQTGKDEEYEVSCSRTICTEND